MGSTWSRSRAWPSGPTSGRLCSTPGFDPAGLTGSPTCSSEASAPSLPWTLNLLGELPLAWLNHLRNGCQQRGLDNVRNSAHRQAASAIVVALRAACPDARAMTRLDLG